MDAKLYKAIIGLALENELYNRRFNKALTDLFSSPNPNKIKALYDRFITSENHFDRETAFWLELALEQKQAQIDVLNIVVRMQEIETMLFDLLWRVDPESQRDFNDWVNYVANASESIREGNWIDAKMFSSQAFQSSRKESINKSKIVTGLWSQIDFLQRETLNCFEEIKRAPSKLEILKERLDVFLEVQGILIELLQKYYFNRLEGKSGDVIARLIQQFNAAQRYLMQSNIKIDKANQTIKLASEYLREEIKNVTDRKIFEWLKGIEKRLEILATQLPQGIENL